MSRLWSLREDVGVEADGEGLTLVAPWAEIQLGAEALDLEEDLRRLTFGPTHLENTHGGGPTRRLTRLLDDQSGKVVHTLESRRRPRLSVSAIPVADPAPFHPAPAASESTVRLSRFTSIRPWAGRLVASRPGADHDMVLEGPDLGALLARLATARQVSDLSGRSPYGGLGGAPVLEGLTRGDVEDVIGWLLAGKVLSARGSDGRFSEDDDVHGWSPHELEFDTRIRRPGLAVEERFRERDGARPSAPLHRPPWQGPRVDLTRVRRRAGTVAWTLRRGYRAPPYTGGRLDVAALGALLDHGARVLDVPENDGARPVEWEYSRRPYLSMGLLYGLELYLALDRSEIAQGLYHYQPDRHCLVQIEAPSDAVSSAVAGCRSHVRVRNSAPAAGVLLTSRRARTEWALGPITHANALSESGALVQVLHLVGRDLGLGVHPVPLTALRGWAPLIDAIWPTEAPVGVAAIEPS